MTDETDVPDEGDAPEDAPEDAPARGREILPPRRVTGRIVRPACIALIVVGLLSIVVAAPSIFDPAGAQCSAARRLIEDANDNDDEFDDVDLGGRDASDVECEEAVRLGSSIPEDEDSDDLVPLPSEGAARTQGIILTIIGLGQAFGGFATLRTGYRRARTIGLVFSGFGIVFPILGIVSIMLLAFIVYGLAFSADAKALWGGRAGSPFFRRPAPPATDE